MIFRNGYCSIFHQDNSIALIITFFDIAFHLINHNCFITSVPVILTLTNFLQSVVLLVSKYIRLNQFIPLRIAYHDSKLECILIKTTNIAPMGVLLQQEKFYFTEVFGNNFTFRGNDDYKIWHDTAIPE